MVKEFQGRDIHIKRIWVLELLVPCLVNEFNDEVLACRVCRFVESMVIFTGFKFSFGLVEFCYRRVPVNCIIIECNDRQD